MNRIEWHDGAVLREVGASVDFATEDGADLVLATARMLSPDDTGEMGIALDKKKSKFEDGGWIVGVFDSSIDGKWEDSLGARAVFYEYGHAGPGDARGPKVTEPKPFLKRSLHINKSRIRRLYLDSLK